MSYWGSQFYGMTGAFFVSLAFWLMDANKDFIGQFLLMAGPYMVITLYFHWKEMSR